MTDTERWQQVKALVAGALDQPAEARSAWLSTQPAAANVRQEAQALLDAEARAGHFLEGGALHAPGAAAALREATAVHGPPRVEIGQVLGAYRIERLIGEGGMGAVYLAARADDAFEKHVAIKLVRGGADWRLLVERLQQERRLLASLDHPNIARLIDGGATSDGVPYVVMEYVDGVAIDEYCQRTGAGVAARLALVQVVCEAVHHAHRNLVVHRDIKPGNILVTADGVPKLLDFGIAKALDSDRSMHTVTGFGAMTPDSASPEQITGAPVTVATDVYGLGVLLYRLLANRAPFAGATSPAALLRAVCEDEPVPPSRVAGGWPVPRDLDLVVLKALRKRPEDRYDSALQLSHDLGHFLAGRPVAAVPDSLAYRAVRFVARHRLATAAGVAAIVAGTAGVGAILWQARIADRERVRAERRFEDVRRLANSLIFELHDAIEPLPGSTPVRRTLVANALTYLDTLAAETGDDLRLKRELAAGYERLASVQGRRGGANLGDQAGAAISLGKALQLRQALVASPAAGPADIVALAGVHERRGQIAASPQLRSAAALEGLQWLDRLPPEAAASPSARTSRAALLWSVGVSRADQKDYPAAAEHYRQATLLYEQLLHDAPPARQAEASRSLSIAYKTLGAVSWVLDARDDAMAEYQKALALDEARLVTQPDNTTWLLDVSFSLASLAHARLNTGDSASALAHYQRSLELRQRALAGDPQNDQAMDAVVRGYRTVARVLDVRGESTAALAASAQAVALAVSRHDAHPDGGRAGPLIDALTDDVDRRRSVAGRVPAQATRLRKEACQAIDRIVQLQRDMLTRGATQIPGPAAATMASEQRSCRTGLTAP